jgi:hypothetical protein
MSGTAEELEVEIRGILENLNTLKDKITASYGAETNPMKLQRQKELDSAKREKNIYDAKFLEEQYLYQKLPRSRNQTLQEFVLLFFYVSLGIFSVALIIYAFLINGQSFSEAAKMLGLCIVMCLLITALLIRLA